MIMQISILKSYAHLLNAISLNTIVKNKNERFIRFSRLVTQLNLDINDQLSLKKLLKQKF